MNQPSITYLGIVWKCICGRDTSEHLMRCHTCARTRTQRKSVAYHHILIRVPGLPILRWLTYEDGVKEIERNIRVRGDNLEDTLDALRTEFRL